VFGTQKFPSYPVRKMPDHTAASWAVGWIVTEEKRQVGFGESKIPI
jgi:hypothetical protein